MMFTYRRRRGWPAGVWAQCQHARRPWHVSCWQWQPLKLIRLLHVSAFASLSHCRLHGNSHPQLETSPRQLVGRLRDQQVTWRQDGVERRPLSGGCRYWSTGNTTCSVCSVWFFVPQPVGGAHSRWTRRSSACRQWTRLHQPRTSKLVANQRF